MRVIAGALRGRRLMAPRGEATRPTSDKVREALFATLGNVSGLKVLDLYAGSGALGIEALSRGAASALFVERGRGAIGAIRKNLAELGVGERAMLLATSVGRAAAHLSGAGPFDLILADPPYAQLDKLTGDLTASAKGGAWWREGSMLVLEHLSTAEPPDLEEGIGAVVEESRRYGGTTLTYYRWPDGGCA